MSGYTFQEVCPWNVKFSKDATGPAFAAREVIAEKDARTLATELLETSQEVSTAFRKSPMKRAKLRGLQRNAAVVVGNRGTSADIPAPVSALADGRG